jgi:hypothetical protein
MHLPAASIMPSIQRLVAILIPAGTIYLSWRVTPNLDRRDELGRLYAAFDPDIVLLPLAATTILLDEQTDSLSSGKLIRRIVARKNAIAS